MRIQDCYLFQMYLNAQGCLLEYDELKALLEEHTNNDMEIPTVRTPLFVGFPTFIEKYDEKMLEDFPELAGELAKLEACDSARQLAEKYKFAEELFDKKEWAKLTFLIERPYRFEFFYWLAIEMKQGVPTNLIYDVWTDSENPSINRDYYIEAFHELQSDDRGISESDREQFNALPEEFDVFRGVSRDEKEGEHELGLSWTLSEETANWFSQRFNKSGVVIRRRISKKDVIHYTNCRGEEEIVAIFDA